MYLENKWDFLKILFYVYVSTAQWLSLLSKTQRYKPRHDKTNKMSVHPTKTQISLGIQPVWSESSLSAWRNLGSLVTHWAHSEDSDQTRRTPRLIWVFAGRTIILLVLSCYIFWTNNFLPHIYLYCSMRLYLKSTVNCWKTITIWPRK